MEDFLELVAEVEASGKRSACGAHRGLSPAADPRINVLKVTPDPGVIEVQHPPGGELGRTGRDHHPALRRGARMAG